MSINPGIIETSPPCRVDHGSEKGNREGLRQVLLCSPVGDPVETDQVGPELIGSVCQE